mmetsp:Transcript_25782/g.84542  ORF Transcript_25782/g.84542 Transcript_25782/m.84542 type:complete len:309 (+) Transcript_25782:294-1220(+)
MPRPTPSGEGRALGRSTPRPGGAQRAVERRREDPARVGAPRDVSERVRVPLEPPHEPQRHRVHHADREVVGGEGDEGRVALVAQHAARAPDVRRRLQLEGGRRPQAQRPVPAAGEEGAPVSRRGEAADCALVPLLGGGGGARLARLQVVLVDGSDRRAEKGEVAARRDGDGGDGRRRPRGERVRRERLCGRVPAVGDRAAGVARDHIRPVSLAPLRRCEREDRRQAPLPHARLVHRAPLRLAPLRQLAVLLRRPDGAAPQRAVASCGEEVRLPARPAAHVQLVVVEADERRRRRVPRAAAQRRELARV